MHRCDLKLLAPRSCIVAKQPAPPSQLHPSNQPPQPPNKPSGLGNWFELVFPPPRATHSAELIATDALAPPRYPRQCLVSFSFCNNTRGHNRTLHSVGATMLSLWSLIKSGLLCTNAVAVLNEERFLAKHGLRRSDSLQQESGSLKAQAADLLHAVRYLRMPLVAINILAILIEFFMG